MSGSVSQSKTATRILPLDGSNLPLAAAGGKGSSLAKLFQAGLAVPPGFVLSTAAYQEFIEAGELESVIRTAFENDAQNLQDRAQSASETIRDAFSGIEIPKELRAEILAAYDDLGKDFPVAVRSSATAEDLPDQSFAGQQESYLNIAGREVLLEAVRACWSSLWTLRAISYRERMGIDHAEVLMAVVVQKMVPSDVSGVLFTANPAGGARDELLINASYGLGEAIVSGQVTPDSFVLHREPLSVKERTLGTKELMIQPVVRASNNESITESVARREVSEEIRSSFSLTEAQLLELGEHGLEIEALFSGSPQDIEWAFGDDKLWILQSRPITGLPEPADAALWQPPTPESRWLRRQVVEHMPGPLSPLFDDLYLSRGLERSVDVFAGTFMGGHPSIFDYFMDRPLFKTINGFAYQRANFRFSFRGMPRFIRLYLGALPKIMKTWESYWKDDILAGYLETISRWTVDDLDSLEDRALLQGMKELSEADAIYWFAASMPIGLSKITDGLLDYMLKPLNKAGRRSRNGETPEPITSGPFLRGFPSKTLEAQTALEEMAAQVRENQVLKEKVLGLPAGELLESLRSMSEAEHLHSSFDDYLARYGHQIYSLDFAEPTQADEPLPILLGLRSLVENPGRRAEAMRAEFEIERESLAAETAQRFGPLRRPLFKKVLSWAQQNTPHREEALFYVGAGWPALRRLALELGRRLVKTKILHDPELVFYLKSEELSEAISALASKQELPDLDPLAKERFALRERRKQIHPPGKVPVDFVYKLGPFDMTAFETQKRTEDSEGVLRGFAVSPGIITAEASVILSPAEFDKMRPGSILVCPTTTPAWTPLFGQAAGLVTDIGGILAHGSIVAREYGIPAVMGTGNATERIQDGQMVRIDGSAGTVEVLDSEVSTVQV